MPERHKMKNAQWLSAPKGETPSTVFQWKLEQLKGSNVWMCSKSFYQTKIEHQTHLSMWPSLNTDDHVLRQEVLWKEKTRPDVTGSLLLYWCSPEIFCKCIVSKISREGYRKWKIVGFPSLFNRRFYATNCEKMEAKIKIPRRGFFAEKTHLVDHGEFLENIHPLGDLLGSLDTFYLVSTN